MNEYINGDYDLLEDNFSTSINEITPIQWRVTLADGDIFVENEGRYIEIEGEILPWRRLCEDLEEDNNWIISLDLIIDNTIIHLPISLPNGRFNLKSIEPDYYSVQNILEVDNILGTLEPDLYLDVTAHFLNPFIGETEIHYIINTTTKESWIIHSSPSNRMVKSPPRPL